MTSEARKEEGEESSPVRDTSSRERKQEVQDGRTQIKINGLI